MKRSALIVAVGLLIGLWAGAPPAEAGGGDAVQGAKTAAAVFELKMRILEGVREASAMPAKPVTSSFLKFLNFVNFDLEQDLLAEQQIKKVYSLKNVSLLTEANLVWERGKSEKAFHVFRLNGQEYLVMVTPGRLAERNQFRIEVFEQSRDRKTSLLDTEFSLPEKNAAVFGFETTELRPYFISLRVVSWSGEAAGGAAGRAPSGDAKVLPPRIVKQVDPAYPELARKARVEGTVILEATTDLYGRVAGVKVLRGVPLLDQAAIDALKQWVYEPMVVDGKPQPVTFVVTMRFNLDDDKGARAGRIIGEVATGVEGGVAGGVEGGVKGGVAGGVEGGVKGGVAGAVEGGVKGGVAGGVEGGVKGGVAGAVSARDLEKFEGDAVRAVGKIKPPKIIKMVEPVYPESARKAKVEGIVVLEAKTDEKGNVLDTRMLRSIPLLDQAAIDAVKQWKYEPMVMDGKPFAVIFTVTVRFTLEETRRSKAYEKFAAGAVRAEKNIPKLIKEVPPVYPEIARVACVQGVVILGIKINEAGKVVDVIVLRSIPLLDQAAIDSVRQWVYEPYVVEGKPVPAVFSVTVRFQLQ